MTLVQLYDESNCKKHIDYWQVELKKGHGQKGRVLVYDVSCINCHNLCGYSDKRGVPFICEKCC